jgi:hypothetical protein
MEETSHASFSEISELPCRVESGVKYVLDAVSGDTGQKRSGRWYICVSWCKVDHKDVICMERHAGLLATT